jgi:hypothetical protein
VKQRIINGTITVLAVCIGVRVAAALVTPMLPALVTFAFVGGLLLWLIGKR